VQVKEYKAKKARMAEELSHKLAVEEQLAKVTSVLG
jgi:hypothetical protein